MYLVESHMGGYYLSDMDIDTIQRTCEQCFDSDTVIFEWNEETKKEDIIYYFSNFIETEENVKDDLINEYITKEELIDNHEFNFNMMKDNVNLLFEENIINLNEKNIIFEKIDELKKEQYSFLMRIIKEFSTNEESINKAVIRIRKRIYNN